MRRLITSSCFFQKCSDLQKVFIVRAGNSLANLAITSSTGKYQLALAKNIDYIRPLIEPTQNNTNIVINWSNQGGTIFDTIFKRHFISLKNLAIIVRLALTPYKIYSLLK
jgi:hypothetical protein